MTQTVANGIRIEYESFGDPAAPAILLIMGLGGQLIHWPDDFCQALAAGGYRVIRFDNRDAGLSDKFEHLGKPKVIRAGIAQMLRMKVKTGYTLDDMADDAIGLLDALGIAQAHVVGASMGGMIGQIMAAKVPQRLLSFTCIMSTSGARKLPKAALRLQLRMARRPQLTDPDSRVEHSIRTWRLISSPGYRIDEEWVRARMRQAHERAYFPRGTARQTVAILAGGSRAPLLKRISTRTLVIHGQDDPLVPVAAGHHLARNIPGARLEVIPGMGHDLPPLLVPRLADLVLANASG